MAKNISGKRPSTWDEYDGVHRGSVDSTGSGSRVHWDELERRPSGQSITTAGGSPARFGDIRRRRWAYTVWLSGLS
jgi:vesicular inhibitory amino acid transporter